MTLLSASTASDRDRYVPRRTTAYHVHMQMFPACPDPSPCGRPTPDKYVSALMPRCFDLALWNSLNDLATSRRHRWKMARRLSPFLSLQCKDARQFLSSRTHYVFACASAPCLPCMCTSLPFKFAELFGRSRTCHHASARRHRHLLTCDVPWSYTGLSLMSPSVGCTSFSGARGRTLTFLGL